MTPEEARTELNRTLQPGYAVVDMERHWAGVAALKTLAQINDEDFDNLPDIDQENELRKPRP